LTQELFIVPGKINGLITLNKALDQEIETIYIQHQTLLDSQQDSIASMSSKLMEESCEHIVSASASEFKKAFLQATTGLDAETSVPTEVNISMDALRKGSSAAMQVHSFRLPKRIFIALVALLAGPSSSVAPLLPSGTILNISTSSALGPSFSDRSYTNPSGTRVAKGVYLDSNKVFTSARSAIKFANELKPEFTAASETVVPKAIPAPKSATLAPLSINAPGKQRVGSPTPEVADQEKDKGALDNEQFNVLAASMGVPDVKNYFDSGFNLIIAQVGSFPNKFVPLRNALIQDGLQTSSPSRRPPEIQAAVLKSKLSEPIDPISFTIAEQDEAEKEITLMLPLIKFVSERTAVGYDSWIHSMFNGKEEYDRTHKTERDKAMRTQLLSFGTRVQKLR
jgi:hypothetical protein